MRDETRSSYFANVSGPRSGAGGRHEICAKLLVVWVSSLAAFRGRVELSRGSTVSKLLLLLLILLLRLLLLLLLLLYFINIKWLI